MALSLGFVLLSVALPYALAAPQPRACTGTISSLSDVSSAVECTTVNINSFTVPAGETFELDLADGTTVNMSERRCPLMSSTSEAYEYPRRRRDICRKELGWSPLPDQVRNTHRY